MSHERTQPPYNQKSIIPEKYDWSSLISRDGTDLDTHYRELLSELGKKEGMMGLIFRKGQNKIQDPSKLRRLIVNLIGKEKNRLNRGKNPFFQDSWKLMPSLKPW